MGSHHSAHGKSDMPAASIQAARVQLFPKHSGMFIKCSCDPGLWGSNLLISKKAWWCHPCPPACLSPCLYFPCLSGPGPNHWLALWLRLLLHSFFWGTGFVSFLVALIKYSDESLSAQVHGGKLSFTRPRIPARGWWHPQWAALPISVNTMKIIAQISPEAHLSDDSRFCQLKDLCQFRTFRNHLMYWQPSMSPVVPPHR